MFMILRVEKHFKIFVNWKIYIELKIFTKKIKEVHESTKVHQVEKTKFEKLLHFINK